MKLDLVPPWLINFIARQLVGHGYKLYQKVPYLLYFLLLNYWIMSDEFMFLRSTSND